MANDKPATESFANWVICHIEAYSQNLPCISPLPLSPPPLSPPLLSFDDVRLRVWRSSTCAGEPGLPGPPVRRPECPWGHLPPRLLP